MAYATITDVQSRITRELTKDEQTAASTLLDDAGVMIDGFNANATADAKKIVSCRMVIRAIGTGDSDVPIGATQGSMSAMGYSQSWTMGTNTSVGEIYLSRADKQILGGGSKIGSYSPVEGLARVSE